MNINQLYKLAKHRKKRIRKKYQKKLGILMPKKLTLLERIQCMWSVIPDIQSALANRLSASMDLEIATELSKLGGGVSINIHPSDIQIPFTGTLRMTPELEKISQHLKELYYKRRGYIISK